MSRSFEQLGLKSIPHSQVYVGIFRLRPAALSYEQSAYTDSAARNIFRFSICNIFFCPQSKREKAGGNKNCVLFDDPIDAAIFSPPLSRRKRCYYDVCMIIAQKRAVAGIGREGVCN